MNDELFDRPAAMRLAAVDRLGLRGEDRIAGLVTGAGYPDALQPIADACRGRRGLLLDVGAGLGAGSVWLRDASGLDVVGMEPESGAAGLARRAFPQLAMACATADALPARPGSCVAVTMLGTASLLADFDAAIAEAVRVLQPGGIIAVTDLCLVGDAVRPSGPNVFRSVEQLAAALEGHGCTTTDAWRAPATSATRWDDVIARVDGEIEAAEGGTEAFRTWQADREELHGLIVEGTLEVGTVIVTTARR